MARSRRITRIAYRYDGLGRPVPQTCEDSERIAIQTYRRCKPKRKLRVVALPGSKVPAAASERKDRVIAAAGGSVVAEAKQIEREASEEVAVLEREVKDAKRIATQAKAQTERIRKAEERIEEQKAKRERAIKQNPRAFPAETTLVAREERAEKRAAEARKGIVRRDKPSDEEALQVVGHAMQTQLHPKLALKQAFSGEKLTLTPESAVAMFPTNPCNHMEFKDFHPDSNNQKFREKLWRNGLFDCSKGAIEGLGKLSRKQTAQLKDKLLGGKVLAERLPKHEDIDAWNIDVDPCDGMTYRKFRPGFTRKEAYWAASRKNDEGERQGPSHKKTNASMAVLKREAWRDRLHACATKVYVNRARVSKNPKLRAVAERYLKAHPAADVASEDFMDGLGRTRPKGVKRCAKAPKKLKKSCAERSFSDNMRHLVCVAKKKQPQALAIAYSVLHKACGTPKARKGTPRKKRTIKQIVTAGKRRKARKATR